jgi:hypothetical protein
MWSLAKGHFPQRAGHYSDESPLVNPKCIKLRLFPNAASAVTASPTGAANKPIFTGKNGTSPIDQKLLSRLAEPVLQAKSARAAEMRRIQVTLTLANFRLPT